jgi:hypothetical protein
MELQKSPAVLHSLRIDMQQLEDQEEEANKLRTRITSKVELLREQAKHLAAMHREKKMLEEEVC